jgi:enediyne biosynthesis protein E4
VSQPCDRRGTIPAPGKIDPELKEFWVENPWHIIASGHNLSCYERKRAFLNVRGKAFLEVSHLSGADNDGDGRAVVAADFRNNGRLDLVVRQVGGRPLILYENRFPQKHYLKVSLRGQKSNRQGVGARLTAVVNGQQLVREMYPHNTYRSQAPNIVHLGLGDADAVERLTIRWPSGKVQELRDLRGDRHIIVDEGKDEADAIQTVVPGRTMAP